MTRKEEIAWAAGFYEGEGCIIYSRSERSSVWRITVVNTDLEPLERFMKVVGAGSIYEVPKKYQAHHKKCFQWQTARSADIYAVVDLLWDHLSARRKEQINDTIRRREERKEQRAKHCSGCGCPVDEHTEGCRQCYFRHWSRDNRLRAVV
jgi:hypothetical protein